MQREFDTFQDRNEWREGSVHAFVDKNTGEVFKPASYNAPAKHVRYDLRVILMIVLSYMIPDILGGQVVISI